MQSQQKRPRHLKNNDPIFDMYTVVKYFGLWIILSLIAFGVKTIVLMALNQSPVDEIGNGLLTLSEVHNTGAAFNLFANQPEMLITVSFFAIAVITFVILVTSPKQSGAATSAMAALSAGITMNMLERINQGYVIDYIHCNHLPEMPVFNVPDIYIVVGAVCLILSVLSKR